MKHKQKTFTFFTKVKGRDTPLHVSTRKYTLELEQEVLIKRTGKEKFNKIFIDDSIDFNFTIEDVKEDFPKLLDIPAKTAIDFGKQDYDELLAVYAFFLLYRKNANARQLQSNNETLALAIQQAQAVLASMPEAFSLKKS